MAFFECHCFSETLGMQVDIWVLLPQRTQRQIGMQGVVQGEKHPTLYLLHGLSDDHSIWMRRTSIERYAAEAGLAVVMPAVHRSFYTDMAHGFRYWSYVSDELPRLMHQFFPLSERREDTCVAGLSMGGYGAFKLALAQPERFGAAASLSGSLDMATQVETPQVDRVGEDLRLIFGDPETIRNTEHDLLHLAAELASNDRPKPKLYQWCGTEDFLYEANSRFRDHAMSLDLPLTYAEGPGGHEWKHWDVGIREVIRWLGG